MTTQIDSERATDLDLLFVPPPRWGFEYVEPPPPAPSPEHASPPVPRPLRVISRAERFGLGGAVSAAGSAAVVAFLLEIALWKLSTTVAIVLAGVIAAPVTWYAAGVILNAQVAKERPPRWRWKMTRISILFSWIVLAYVFSEGLKEYRAAKLVSMPDPKDQPNVDAEHRAAREAWTRRMETFEATERARYESADRWYPVCPPDPRGVTTLFGGTHVTWAAFLCTYLSSILGAGRSVLVLDLSRRWTTAPLFDLCTSTGVPSVVAVLPGDAVRAGLFKGLSWDELSSVLVEVLHADTADEDAAHRDKLGDRSVIRDVAEELRGGEVSLRRLRRALQVVEGNDNAADGQVSAEEFRSLSRLYNDVQREHGGVLERVTRIERDLRYLERLAPADMSEGACGPLLSDQAGSEGLTILEVDKRTDDLDNGRLVNLLFQLLISQLRAGRRSADVIVALGADRLRTRALDALITEADHRSSGVVLLLEHLRKDAVELLGTGGARALFGSLGNHREAQEAVEFIGSDYKWVESSLTTTQGNSITETWGDESGQGYQVTNGLMGTATSSSTSSRTYSTSFGRSSDAAVAESRVYEKVVEPSVIQGLAVTQLISVQVLPGGRRVTKTVDCLPPRRFEPKLSLVPLALPS